MGEKITEVVAALIFEGEKFMICQRPAHKTRGLLWEFVGGKVERGESGEEALQRECREELDVEIEVGEVYMELLHRYPDITIHLTLYRARILSGRPKLLEHRDLRYILPREIDDFSFCPADREILERLRGEGAAP